tara:strand:- start:7328 stop:7813 length:486 start_codon:yes stop_codon:yes gene_type:complete
LLLLTCTSLTWAALPSAAHAEGQDKGVFGAGLIVGEPTGLSLKYYLGDDTAIDGAIGGAFLGKGLQVHADFLWHPWILESKPSFALPAYVGLGARVLDRNGGGGDEDHFRIGARFVGGLLFDFREVPLDVFVEVAGVTDYRTKGSAFGLDINLGAGVRYYF